MWQFCIQHFIFSVVGKVGVKNIEIHEKFEEEHTQYVNDKE